MPDPVHGLSRFNMPFEMGLCFGAMHFGKRKKILLVMETEPFDYRKFMSDIAGRDIEHHAGRPGKMIEKVRNWLNAQTPGDRLPGGHALQTLYEKFRIDLPSLLQKRKILAPEVTFIDWSNLIGEWLIKETAKLLAAP